MKGRDSIGSHLERGIAVVVACASVIIAPVQAPAAPVRRAAPRPTVPPLSGPGSLNGVWNDSDYKDYRTGPPVGREREIETADGKPIPYTPAAQAILDARRKSVSEGKPVASNGSSCLTDGMPSVMHPPKQLPIQIIETPDQKQVTVLFEYFGTFRIIHLDEKHPGDPDPTFMGNSVGHWEGGTLVVDTIALNDKTPVARVPHSEDLHLVERIRRTSATTLEDRITIEDPKTFTRPWTMVNKLKQVPGMRVREYVCENNRNGVDENGRTDVQLESATQ